MRRAAILHVLAASVLVTHLVAHLAPPGGGLAGPGIRFVRDGCGVHFARTASGLCVREDRIAGGRRYEPPVGAPVSPGPVSAVPPPGVYNPPQRPSVSQPTYGSRLHW